MSDRFATHNVTNQVPPLTDVNLFASDTALNDAVTREGAAASARTLNAFGLTAGSQESRELAILANRHTPELSTHDRYGRRLDVVATHIHLAAQDGARFGREDQVQGRARPGAPRQPFLAEVQRFRRLGPRHAHEAGRTHRRYHDRAGLR